ncbi:MAG: methyltransferase domain-containing protein [bacterium]
MGDDEKCLVCSSSDVKKIDKKDEYALYKCRSCGFGFAWPRPKIDALKDIYDEAFDENSEKGIWSGELTKDNPKGKRSGMDNFGTDEKEYTDRLDILRKHLQGGDLSILDVGCAAGFFVDFARRSGWKADGLDVSGYNARMAKENFDLDIVLAPLMESGLPGESYDAVIMRCILEHSVDPYGDLAEVWRLLKPGGIVYIYIPNEFNPLQNLATRHVVKKRWWFAAPHHLNFFTPSSLEKILNNVGFETEYLTTSFPVEIFLLLGVDYVNFPEKGKRVGATVDAINKLSEKHEIIGRARDLIYERLIRDLNIGRTIISIAKKR